MEISMKPSPLFDKIDIHLIRVLHTVLTERSVSRTALKMGMYQPAVSAALRQLRSIMGDALLVRSGAHMVPTELGLHMIEPSARVLEAAQALFVGTRAFDPRTEKITFKIGASDFLDPFFLPQLVTQMKLQAPLCRIEIRSLSEYMEYSQQLSSGDLDLVIGNWTQPSKELHRVPLFEDDVVSMVSQTNPVVRRGWDQKAWLEAEHLAPTSTHLGGRGVIDEHLSSLGLNRNIVARSQNFGLMPGMVASTLLVLTTGRHYCERYIKGFGGQLPLTIVDCPIDFPKMSYYQLWHDRSHMSASLVWLRTLVKSVADGLRYTDKPLTLPH
jgi:DNA-binding transcriptional LysR family regulator